MSHIVKFKGREFVFVKGYSGYAVHIADCADDGLSKHSLCGRAGFGNNNIVTPSGDIYEICGNCEKVLLARTDYAINVADLLDIVKKSRAQGVTKPEGEVYAVVQVDDCGCAELRTEFLSYEEAEVEAITQFDEDDTFIVKIVKKCVVKFEDV